MGRSVDGKHPFWRAILKYQRHRALAKFRGIDFNFNYEDWYQWWLNQGIDKNVDVKWQGGQRPCMCRYDDKGPYEIGNVYMASNTQNVQDAWANGKWKPVKKIYLYNGQPMTIWELRDVIGYKKEPKFFHKDHIDAYKQVEFKRLSNKYDRLPKYVKTPRLWEGNKDSWHTSEQAAYTELGITQGRYQYLTDQGYVRRKIVQGLTLEEYIRQNSRYPDPKLA